MAVHLNTNELWSMSGLSESCLWCCKNNVFIWSVYQAGISGFLWLFWFCTAMEKGVAVCPGGGGVADVCPKPE